MKWPCNGKKYELTDETIEWGIHTLHRIRALVKISSEVRKGDLGGFVESENNLSQEGDCWVFDEAKIAGNARVEEDARVSEKSIVCENACVTGSCCVYGKALVCDNAKILGDSSVGGNAFIRGNATIMDRAIVSENIIAYQNAIISGNAKVVGAAEVYENAMITGKARVCGDAIIRGNAVISEHQFISSGVCENDLSKNLISSIIYQTNLMPFDGKVIAYKQVRKDMRSFCDKNFKYEIGKVVKAKALTEEDINNKPCGRGLYFSNATYWNKEEDINDSLLLAAEINLDDIITVQMGTIRCKRAKILGVSDFK